MRRRRPVTAALPSEVGKHLGLAYSLWLPNEQRDVPGAVLILHGAGSCKESHHDFARVVLGAGFAALSFDQRGHGSSDGAMDEHALDDIASVAELLRSRAGVSEDRLALRGSSMGGCLAILAAELVKPAAIVAICPASTVGLRRLLTAGGLPFRADVNALEALLERADLESAVEALNVPLLLLHAEGDEQVPVQHSRELAEHLRAPGSRFITLPGGHHRSIQHDEELQAVSLRFIQKSLAMGL